MGFQFTGMKRDQLAKIIYLGIVFLMLTFSQQAKAQPVFQPASIDSAPLGNRIPLILIQGIQSDPSMWNNFLNYYAAHPALQNNFKPYTFAYKTDDAVMVAADPNDIFGLCPILGNFLQQSFGTQRVAILAHSMGGFISADKEQQLRLVFATHEVVIRGFTLRRIEAAMHRMELASIVTLPAKYQPLIADGQPKIREIVVTEAKAGGLQSEASLN
jgi:hypothetical protein